MAAHADNIRHTCDFDCLKAQTCRRDTQRCPFFMATSRKPLLSLWSYSIILLLKAILLDTEQSKKYISILL